ncbi:MHC class I polypeptide-related sequence B-like isoform X2 [Oryx dammah]|uniref:MHC class I polypeptide-related sequence B-like isoform X2 n=1 Tax=Oryx dammah TaxID=59534 RepID=UPI001A9AAABE|nr:MHC class I polypeptide-related sequence B-like isoform X2 [Oryx dammah]
MDLLARLHHSSVLRRGSSGPLVFLRSRSLWQEDKIWAMGLSRVWQFLAVADFFVSLGNAAGSHILLYNVTVLSWDGFVQSRFFAEGCLDHQIFLHYDHKKGRAEPWGRWAEKLGSETWETESKDLNETWKELRKLLAEILSLQKEKGGFHSLQETVGCKIHEDSHPRGFRLLHFNGELLLSCCPEAHGCALPQSSARTLAMEVMKSWDTDGFLSKHYQAHVQGELCGRLRGYLESWTGFMERTVPPAVSVTRSQDSEGIHLTGKTLVHQRSWWIVSVPVVVVFIIGFCVCCYIKKRKTASATGRPGSPGPVWGACVGFCAGWEGLGDPGIRENLQ